MRTFEIRDRRADYHRTYKVDTFEDNRREAENTAFDKVQSICTADRDQLAIVGCEEQ